MARNDTLLSTAITIALLTSSVAVGDKLSVMKEMVMLTQQAASNTTTTSSSLSSSTSHDAKLNIWGFGTTTLLPSPSSSSPSSATTSITTVPPPPSSYRLRLLNVVFRHGENIPDEHDMTVIPRLACKTRLQDWGELTNAGKLGGYEFGQFLRNTYGEFIGSSYTHGSVRAISSDFDRTKLALELVLAGLFPHTDLWQPAPPTGYTLRSTDNIFLGDECVDFQKRYDRLAHRPSIRRKFAPYRNLAQKLTNIIGTSVRDQKNMAEVYHALIALNSTDRSLPVWTRGIFPLGQLYDAALLHYDIIVHDRTLRKLFGGPLLRKMTENMLNHISGVSIPPRLFIYSGHVNNLIGLLSSLNLYHPHIPDFSSAIIIELLENDDKHYYVKISYRNRSFNGGAVQVLALPGCDEICPIEHLLRVIANDVPSKQQLANGCLKRKNLFYHKPSSSPLSFPSSSATAALPTDNDLKDLDNLYMYEIVDYMNIF